MRFLAFLFIFSLIIPSAYLQAQDISINTSPAVPNEVNESVKDMVYWLEKATGKKFIISSDANAKGISLKLVNEVTLSSDQRKQISKDGQSFLLKIDNTYSVQIIGTTANSFINGVYTFLHELGFRWYMPGENWTCIPKLGQWPKINKVYTPSFRNRFYFGTGGMNPIKDVDPKNEFAKDFNLWDKRNRMIVDQPSKGHQGQNFVGQNKDSLKNHPEYFCNNNIKSGYLNIDNPDAVRFYIKWAKTQVKPGDLFPVIGVEPPDGSGVVGDCLSSDSLKIKNYSDKYFWIANKVAESLPATDTSTMVQLYAYHTHVAPPGFELNKRIYPIIIPYIFQYITDPDVMISRWVKKLHGRPMGMYDYWNITQWTADEPQFNIYDIAAKLKTWKKNNVTSIYIESTNAKGPMGHAWWLASQLMWDINQPFDKLYTEFLQNCFGPAAEDIRRMYDRWSLNYQYVLDVPLSLRDLEQASSKTTDTTILSRIRELKAYIHFRKLRFDTYYEPSAEAFVKAMEYVYSIHQLRLVQTSAIGLYMKKPHSEANLAANTLVKPITAAEIEKNFQDDLQQNPAPYNPTNVKFDIKKATVAKADKLYTPYHMTGTTTYDFYLPQSRKISFYAKAGEDGKGKNEATKFVVKDGKGEIILQKEIERTQTYDTIAVSLTPGKYSLSFGRNFPFQSKLIVPTDIPLFRTGNDYYYLDHPVQYIYVPKGAEEIVYMDKMGPNTGGKGFWISPLGDTVRPQKIKYYFYRAAVPAGQSGKVWRLVIVHKEFKMLNIPDVYSVNPFKYEE